MYAIIRHGGKQYRVSKGDTLVIDRVDGEVGSKLQLDDILMVRDDKTLTGADAGKAKVTAIILEHLKGDKVLVFKYKPKKNHHRMQGHRQHLTKVKIEDISVTKGGGRKKATKAKEPIEAPAPEVQAEKTEQAIPE